MTRTHYLRFAAMLRQAKLEHPASAGRFAELLIKELRKEKNFDETRFRAAIEQEA